MVVVISVDELRPLVIVCGAGSVIHLIKVSVNQPAMVVIGSATRVDVLEGRKKKRQQHPEARLYGRDTTHSVIDCTRADKATSKRRLGEGSAESWLASFRQISEQAPSCGSDV